MQNTTPYSFRDVISLEHTGPITVMDAHCALCARGARWIARNDTKLQFRIVPLQSETGRILLTHYGIDPDDPTTWLLLQDGMPYGASDAVIRTGKALGGVWKSLAVLRIIPRPILDPIYHLIARNRIKWFGRADMCTMPDQAVQQRLLK
jgi:predicted DCC family thiol-disulfide oxidoreductase YuxK